MKNYQKFVSPTWQQFEEEIKEYFKTHDIGAFKDCPQIRKTMIVDWENQGMTDIQRNHLSIYQKYTKNKKKTKDIKSFIEIGGGYGSLCKLIKETNNNPYTIIDIPTIIKIQEYFLQKEININYIDVNKLEKMDLNCEMFISLFALSETTDSLIKYIISKNFFNANHILMCFRNRTDNNFKVGQSTRNIQKFYTKFKKYGNIVKINKDIWYLIK